MTEERYTPVLLPLMQATKALLVTAPWLMEQHPLVRIVPKKKGGAI